MPRPDVRQLLRPGGVFMIEDWRWEHLRGDNISAAMHDASEEQRAELNRTYIGFVFQQFFLIPQATVLDNVVLPLKIAGVGAGERKDRGMAALRQLGIEDHR